MPPGPTARYAGRLRHVEDSNHVGAKVPTRHGPVRSMQGAGRARRRLFQLTAFMGKYDPLTGFLSSVPVDEVRVGLRFGDVDRLVGGLPTSARKYRPWWSNGSHVQARAWRLAGWHVQEVNLAEGRVVFERGAIGGS